MTRLLNLIIPGLPALCAAALLCVLPLAPASAQAPGGDLQQAVAALRAITTLRADFTQTDAGGQRVSGVMSLKNPGKIRFQYNPGYPMLIVSDGRALTLLDTELNKMQRWPIGNSPLGALLDPSRDVSKYGTVLPGFDAGALGIAVRDRTHPEYGTITLVFLHKPSAPGGLELWEWISQDAQGHHTTTRLTNHRYGVAVDEGLFHLINPAARPHH